MRTTIFLPLESFKSIELKNLAIYDSELGGGRHGKKSPRAALRLSPALVQVSYLQVFCRNILVLLVLLSLSNFS